MSDRRFARLSAAPATQDGASAVPSDGMCLSVFLVIHPADRTGAVLLGRVAPGPEWATVGGLSAARLDRIGDRWMLPSSQLLLLEGPDAAADRVAREQLGGPLPDRTGPAVFSETYGRPGASGDPHWDLHFVYSARWRGTPPAPGRLWRELAFVDVASTPAASIARGQADVLDLVGLRARRDPPS